VNEAERSGDTFERALNGRVIRRLLLQHRERTPHRLDSNGRVRGYRSPSRALDLKESPHGSRDGFSDGHQLLWNCGIGLNRAERVSK